MALRLLPLGAVLSLVALFISSRTHGLDPVDRLFLPSLASGFSLLALILWRLPQTAPGC